MTKSFETPRLACFFIAGKMAVATALLFALTLPMTTCSIRGSVQEHRVELTAQNIGTILCFVWPVVLIGAQLVSARARLSLGVLIFECVLAVFAWALLALEVFVAQVFSLGGIRPAAGYDLACYSLAGYFALSFFEGSLLFVDRRASRILLQAADRS